MNEIEGNKFRSRVMKKKGITTGYESSHEGVGETAFHDIFHGLPEVGFDAGRTIALRQFEFCRIKLGLRLRYKDDLDRSDVRVAAKRFVLEMLRREESAVTNPNEKFELNIDTKYVDILNSCISRAIRVSYGLTLKTAKQYESEQVDNGEELPVDDGVDILESFEELSNMLASEISIEHDRIKSVGRTVA